MPWNDQKSGKDSGNKSNSPWGGGTNKPSGKKENTGSSRPNSSRPNNVHNLNSGGSGGNRGGGPTGPDIDAMLRKGQDQFKKMGGGFIALIIIVIAVVFWLFNSFYIVQQNEQAVELRFGEPKQVVSADGLHFYFWPIETYRKVPLTEQSVTIGSDDNNGLMLSGDQNIVRVKFAVYYYIDNPASYLFNVKDPASTIRQVAESAMREVVGRRPADDVYRNRREIIAGEVRDIIQTTVNKYGLGVKIGRVSIREAAPPKEVAAAFNGVQQAEQERNRSIEQGNQERARLNGQANGAAAGIRERAAAYKARVIEEARGEAQRFVTVEKEAQTAPEATRFRLYVETLEQLLSSPGKVVIGSGEKENSVVPYLPLNKLLDQNNKQTGRQNSASSSAQNTRNINDTAAGSNYRSQYPMNSMTEVR